MSARSFVSDRVVLPEGVRPAAVVVREGVIERIGVPGDTEGPVESLGDRVLMPGLVDTHVHVNEPGRTEWEGFTTATRAAAAGGITTIVDMPLNCIPVTTTAAALAVKLEACTPQLWVDTAFWGGLVPDNAERMEPLVRAGVVGVKTFLIHSGIDDFPASDESHLRRAMPVLARAGVPLIVHAELDLGAPSDGARSTSYGRYLRSRPPEWEEAAIELVIRLCEETGCAVHIVHLSAASALPMIRDARSRGLPVTAETCPHYLCLSAEEVAEGATEFKCAPPIREARNREQLWEGLMAGDIDFVTSDHSPCTPELKVPERGDFMEAWGGIASLQLGLSSVWTEARKRGASESDLCRWMCEKPTHLVGLEGRKGKIAVGFDADLVVWDPDAEWSVEAGLLHHRHKVSPYLGRRVLGSVRSTWLRGERIAQDGVPCAAPSGRPLLRRPE